MIREVNGAVSGFFGNPGRSGHSFSRSSANLVFAARETLAGFLSLQKSENIVFTYNATHALNMAIQGTVAKLSERFPRPVVLTSVFEHNSVLRPLYALEEKGEIELRLFSPSGQDGGLKRFTAALCPRTRLCVLTARSNVTGRSFPLDKIGPLLRKKDILLIVDASQLLGSQRISMPDLGADILCAPGHKGLLGIMGSGLMAFGDSCRVEPEVILSGGSGADSKNKKMPLLLPERFEAGTLSVPAVASIKAGAEFITSLGIEAVSAWENEMKGLLASELKNMRGVTLYEGENKEGPLLFNVGALDPNEAADFLDKNGVMARAGFHCAPLAHAFLGTGEKGAVRLSPGPFTTKAQIRYAVDKIYKCCK